MPAMKPTAMNISRPMGVRWIFQSILSPVLSSVYTPQMRRAEESLSACPTSGSSDFLAMSMRTTMARMVAPSAVWTTWVGRARPTMAPTIAQVEAIRATGMARRRLARLVFSSPGPAASAPLNATRRPQPRTKSR